MSGVKVANGRVISEGVFQGMTRTDAIKAALDANSGGIRASIRWLEDRGISVSRGVVNRVRRGPAPLGFMYCQKCERLISVAEVAINPVTGQPCANCSGCLASERVKSRRHRAKYAADPASASAEPDPDCSYSGQPWRLPDDGIVDLQAVHIVISGERSVRLTRPEAALVARHLAEAGIPYEQIAARVGCTPRMARTLALGELCQGLDHGFARAPRRGRPRMPAGPSPLCMTR